MSYQAVDAVYRNSRAKGTDHQVLVYLAHRAGNDGRGARPSRVEIVEAIHLDPKTVTAAIARLEDAGEIYVERAGGRGHRNVYDLLIMRGPVPETGEPDSPLSETGETGESGELESPVYEGETGENQVLNSPVYGAETGEPDSPANTKTLLENPTTTNARETTEAEDDALVVVVGDEKRGGGKERSALVEEMTALGVTATVAADLARDFPAARIRRQIAYLRAEHRSGADIRNAGGRLRKRIEQDWSPPTQMRGQASGRAAPSIEARVSYAGPQTNGPPASPESVRDILKTTGLK